MALRKLPDCECWVYQCKVNGRTWARSTGQTDRQRAKKEIPRLEKLAQLHREQPNGSLKLAKAIVQEVARVEIDVSEERAYRVSVGLLNFRKFAGDIYLDQIDTALLEKYQRMRLTKVSRYTADSEICMVRKILRLSGFEVPKPTPKAGRVTEQRAFTMKELKKFFQACPDRLRIPYAVMLVTGARPAEVIPSNRSKHVALLKREIDIEDMRITIRSAKSRGRRGKIRVLPLPEELVEPLKRQMAQVKGQHVFKPFSNGPRDFDDILGKAGIPKYDELGQKLTGHSFRHTYATLVAEAIGHNPFVLKEILGHKRLSTTERYCHPTAPSIVPEIGKTVLSSF